jgi:hypothetical protein
MKIDWLQRVVHSDAAFYAIYAVFLAGAWIIAGIMRLRGHG